MIDEVHSLLGSDGFIMVNKKLLRFFKGNADTVVLLVELVNIHKMVSNKLNVDEFGYFRIPKNWIFKVLGMSPGKQKTILKTLESEDLVDVVVKGFPATRHIALNFFNIKEMLEMDETTKEDIQRKEFYDHLNIFLTNSRHTLDIVKETKVFGNMKKLLSDSIKLISLYTLQQSNGCYLETFDWSGRSVGTLRDFLNKKSLGKPFDYSFLSKVCGQLKNFEPQTTIEVVEQIIKISRKTVDNSPADQILSFEPNVKELIDW